MWHQLHPYVGSFGLVAAYSVQHAVILHYAPYCDRNFIWLNILFLLPLTLLPFRTELVPLLYVSQRRVDASWPAVSEE